VAKIRVLIVDDHAILREGIRALLALANDVEVVGEAADGREAIDQCRRLDPDVILMDVAMPGLGGLEATLEIRRENQRVKILVLTQYEDREYARRFLGAGVSGYLLKKAAASELLSGIRAASAGGLVLDPKVARDVLDTASRPSAGPEAVDPYDALTPREKQVLKLIAEGRSSKEAAQILGVSVKTAMSHRERVMEKLDLHSRTELIRFALRKGVIAGEP
jgi:DNA-binding NarL/FixJ family response regulator